MRVRLQSLALLLLLMMLPPALAQTPTPAPPPPAPKAETAAAPAADANAGHWAWLVSGDRPVTAGTREVDPDLWQHTWGFVGFSVIPVGSKMAPNGIPYDPLFTIDLLLNVALTADRAFYLFGKTHFWAQKPGDNITNSDQGRLDFSKRQIDLDLGIAWNFYSAFEARAFAYSDNNLNRGRSLAFPFGYNDGFALECRYYFPSTDFDRGLYRYVGVGYMPTKDQIGQDGVTFKPSAYLTASLALDFIPQRFYAYLDLDCIGERQPWRARLLWVDPGLAVRPFEAIPCLEFRVGSASTIDWVVGYTRAILYATARVVW